MEFIWIIIGIIWFVVSISNKAQKEQQKQRQQANRQQPVRPGQPRPAQSRMQQPRPTAPHPAVQPAPRELQDKHYLRKHGKNAYYGQG